MATKPIIVRWRNKNPFVLSCFAGREAEICVGFGMQAYTKKDFLQAVGEWYDVVKNIEKQKNENQKPS
jgi:hypothetical protein